jgi:hypothetical protein
MRCVEIKTVQQHVLNSSLAQQSIGYLEGSCRLIHFGPNLLRLVPNLSPEDEAGE